MGDVSFFEWGINPYIPQVRYIVVQTIPKENYQLIELQINISLMYTN